MGSNRVRECVSNGWRHQGAPRTWGGGIEYCLVFAANKYDLNVNYAAGTLLRYNQRAAQTWNRRPHQSAATRPNMGSALGQRSYPLDSSQHAFTGETVDVEVPNARTVDARRRAE